MTKKELRNYLLPAAAATVGTSLYILADTFFISVAAGEKGIAALNIALPLYGLIYAIGGMIGIGSATRFSLERETKGKNLGYFPNALFWCLAFGLVFTLSGAFFTKDIMKALGADGDILTVGYEYTFIILAFSPLFMLGSTVTAFVRNDGSPKTAMAATLLSGLFNIAFDYILMFPLNLGMKGAALATGFSPVVSMSICLTHLLSKKSTLRLFPFLPSFKTLLHSCALGISAFVGEISGGITTMVFNYILIGLGGNTAVAAYGVTANAAIVVNSLLGGISQGLQPPASRSAGRGDRPSLHLIYSCSLKWALAVALISLGGVLLFAEGVVAIFNSSGSRLMAEYACPGIRMYFTGFVFAAVNIITCGFYSAVGRGRESSVIALSRGLVAITAFALILSRVWGLTGVWLSFAFSEGFTLLLSLFVRALRRQS